MLEGDSKGTIARDLGITSASVESYAYHNELWDSWKYLQEENSKAIIARLQARALDAVEGRAATIEATGSTPQGTTSRKEHRIDAAMISQVAVLTDHATYGRQAGKQQVQVGVAIQVNVQRGDDGAL